MKKKTLVIVVIIVVAVLAVAGAGVALAVWTTNDHASLYVKTSVVDDNTSVKYQMYVPVKSSGSPTSVSSSAYERVDGTFSIVDDVYYYYLTDYSEASSIVGFALVGWFGGYSLDFCRVPSTVTVNVNGSDMTKPVVRVMVDGDFIKYAFTGANTVIRDITIEENIVEVDKAAFSGMEYLEKVTFVGDENSGYLYLKQGSFACCTKLRTVDDHRPKAEGWNDAMAFMDSYVLDNTPVPEPDPGS